MRRNNFVLLVALAVFAVFAGTQSAASASQGTWSEHPPGVGQDKQQKNDKGAASSDRDSIQKLVQQQLQSDPALGSVNADVDNSDVVTLSGNVATKNDRDHAKQLAESVPGVKKVKDKIKIGVSASGPPSEHYAASTQSEKGNTAGSIAGNSQSQPGSNPMASSKEDQIQNAIQNQVVGSRVWVRETDNNIVVSGVVPSNDAKTQAEQIAQQYASDKQVVNELSVASVSAASPSGRSGSAMRRRIEEARRNEATLSPTVAQNIAVNTINNNVILSGTVPAQADKDKAQQVARQHADGMHVVNNIQVSSPSSSASSEETAGGIAGPAGSTASTNSSQSDATSGNIGTAGESSSASAAQSTTTEQAPIGGATAAQDSTDLKTQIENSLQKEQLTGP
jgi:osmotically-inducible protein OsmY